MPISPENAARRDLRRSVSKHVRTLHVDPELTLLELEALYMLAVRGHIYLDYGFFTGPEQAAQNRALHKLRAVLDDTGRFETFRDRLFPRVFNVIGPA